MLNKIEFMRNLALVLTSVFFLSCEDPTNIGFLGEDGSVSKTYFSDTLSLETSTYLMDSAFTSNQAAALVGSFDDPIFGSISSAAYIQPTLKQATNPVNFSLVTSPFTASEGVVFDSLVLRLLNKDLILYGDTLPNMTLQLHRLKSSLNGTQNYNYNDAQAFDDEPLATIVVNRSSFTNSTKDSLFYIKFKLPVVIGQELMALANSDDAKDKDKFSKAFPGFRISAKSGAKTIAAFNLGSLAGGNFSDLALYFHSPGATTSEGYQFEFTSGRYNQISTNRAGTVLSSLLQQTSSISSKKTGGKIYLQAGNGTAGKVNFPGLANLKNPQIGRAELVFKADTTAFNARVPKAPFITFLEINDNQKIKMVNGNYGYINYTLNATSGVLSTYVDSTNSFIADVTPYLQNLSSKNKKDNGIAMVVAIPSNTGISGFVFNAGLNRIVLQNFKLNLYYTEK
jgi:hypothetical protein